MEINYFEDLASTGIPCPHIDAFVPDGMQEYYRALKMGIPPSDNYIPSKIHKDKPELDECIKKSVSIYDNQERLINAFYKTPAHKKKTRILGLLVLNSKDGMLKQTFNPGHHSWWRSKEFNPDSVKIMEVEA